MVIDVQHEVSESMLLKAQFWAFDLSLIRPVTSILKFEPPRHDLSFAALSVSLRLLVSKLSVGGV